MASYPGSDNSWVFASSESLPVETLGPESTTGLESMMDPESDRASQALGSPSRAAAEELAGAEDGGETLLQSEGSQSGPILPEKTEAEAVLEDDGCTREPSGLGDTLVQGDAEEAPVVAGLGPDTEDLEGQSPPQSQPSSPDASWPMEEAGCSSSEDDTDVDVEGLRRRRGLEPSAPQPVRPLGLDGLARGEGAGGELSISVNMCLLGALVLLGLGILLFSSGLSESDSGPAEELQVLPDSQLDTEVRVAVGDRQDELRQHLQAAAPSAGVPSLQNMALLLDRLAKENQDIRLLQAQLQAQKEELQSLMQQPRALEEENARLRGALQDGEASQRALESELQRLRARLQGLEADCTRGPDGMCLDGDRGSRGSGLTGEPSPGLLEQKERLEAEAQALRQELEKQRRLLGSVQQDLERSLRGVGRGDAARASLTELGHRLVQKIQGMEKWSQHPWVSANTSEARPQESRFQSAREWSGKEKWQDGQGGWSADHWKQKKEGSGWERKKSWRGEEDRELAGRWKEGRLRLAGWGGKKDGRQQGPKEPPRKSGGPHSSVGRQKHPQWKEGADDGHDLPPLWAELSRHKYRAPQGCSGVRECARQEGLAFGVELAPVQRQELASLLRTYLARLPWAGQLTKDLPLSPAYFGEDGIFRHDRLRFRDFVDALEDSLEEVAVRQTGDDDEVDDFEGFIFSHFFGDKSLRKRSGKKDRQLQSPGRG
ncbi:pre-B-cell leukemia transcription factor-interacting protein 1 isoform 1-T2 [Lycaon pictus]